MTARKIDFKAQLEKKLCLARETPEPVFDLSDCNLKRIPSSVFVLCKVLRKDALHLQENQLSSFTSAGSLDNLKYLKILNISSNQFTELPCDISCLKCLEIFDVSNNQLKRLPSEIGTLKKLKYLNVSKNNLKSLPFTIGSCQSLEVLNLLGNKSLKELPISVGRLKNLVELELDTSIVNPPQEVCQGGIICVLKFLRQELTGDVEYSSTSSSVDIHSPNASDRKLQNRIEELEKRKEKAKAERLSFEKKLKNEKEVDLQTLREQKLKLLENLKNELQEVEKKLAKVQEQKNIDRALLVKLCREEEESSIEAVQRILNNNKNLRNHVLDDYKRKKKEEEEKLLFIANETYTDKIKKNQILVAMDEAITEEFKKCLEVSSGTRTQNVKSLVAELASQNENLKEFIQKVDTNKNQLISDLRISEELQKSAVASILEKSDAASWELKKQISLIENKLLELTRVEIAKKKLETDIHIAELNKNRLALAEFLMSLLEEQAKRREHLIEMLHKMEDLQTKHKTDDFWLKQYEKLLHSNSYDLVTFLESLDPNLIYEFFVHGVFRYLPLLKGINFERDELAKLNVVALNKLNIHKKEDQQRILKAILAYLQSSYRKPPSAPQSLEPSAPAMSDAELMDHNIVAYMSTGECVVCLDAKLKVLFVPCGHICCCYECSKNLVSCPLCRKPIHRILETTS